MDSHIARASTHPLKVFALGTSTLGQTPFTRPSTLNEPISIALPHLDDPLIITPGDVIMADENGVVCIPRELAEDVVVGAEKQRSVDALCEEDLRGGKGVKETFAARRGK